MATYVKGRGIRVEVATVLAAAVTGTTAITLANPGVVTDASHGLSNNAVGFYSGMTGMEQLEDQAFRVKNVTTDTFELQGLNTTNYTAFTSGSYQVGTTWATIAEATAYSVPDANTEDLDATTLLDVIDVIEAGNLAAQPITIPALVRETPSTGMAFVDAAARTGTKVLLRITLQGGGVRVYYGTPSAPGEDVQAKQLGKGSFSVKGRGLFLKLAA
jgi:hypothetical protein